MNPTVRISKASSIAVSKSEKAFGEKIKVQCIQCIAYIEPIQHIQYIEHIRYIQHIECIEYRNRSYVSIAAMP